MRKIIVPIRLWVQLIYGLKTRCQGKRESGGLLSSKRGKLKVKEIVFYDQFDKTVSDSGIIEFKGGVRLYEYLANKNMEIMADIHTHPTSNTSQSTSDKSHPIIRIKGHIAIIAPNFAKNIFLLPKDCSIYEYQGELTWKKCEKTNSPIHLNLF